MQSTGGGFTGAGETSLLGTFPAEFPADFATALIPLSNSSSTLHVENNGPLGAGAVSRINLLDNNTGDFQVEQLGYATLGILRSGDFESATIDTTQVAFVPIEATPPTIALRSGAVSLSSVGTAPEAPPLTAAQVTTRNAAISTFQATLQGVINSSLLSSLSFADGANFYISDDTRSPIYSDNLLHQFGTILGGFDCDDYALVGGSFLRNNPTFSASGAAVTTYGVYFNVADENGVVERAGHAVNLVTFTPAIGPPIYFGYDAQSGVVVQGVTPHVAVSNLLFSAGYASLANNNGPDAIYTFAAPYIGDNDISSSGQPNVSFLANPQILQQFISALQRLGVTDTSLYLP